MQKTYEEQIKENQMIFQEAVKNGEDVKSNENGNYIIKKTYDEKDAEYQDGSKGKVTLETIYAIYESGRKDCHLNVLKSIDSGAVSLRPKGLEKGEK